MSEHERPILKRRPQKKAKKPHGRPSHVPTEDYRSQVQTLAIAGTPQELIARVIGISDETLRKYYRDELDTALVKANAAVARNLYRKATGDGQQAVSAARFWLICRAGWKESAQDINATISGTIDANVTTFNAPPGMTPEKFAQIAQELASKI